MNFTFTIVTVTLNNYEGLLNTYDSITIQSSRDYQWVVIDGNSSDDTCKFLTSLKKSGSQVKWISENDSGIYNAMNKGVSLSDGDYVIFLNAGDVFADNEVLQDIIYTDALYNYDIVYGNSFEQKKDKEFFLKRARKHNFIWYGMFTHHQAILYKREMLILNPYSENLTIASDYDLTSKLILKEYSCKYIDSAICKFELGGLSIVNYRLSLKEQMQVRKNNFKWPIPLYHCFYLYQYILYFIRNNIPFIYITYRKLF